MDNCRGKNCGTLKNGRHSAECIKEYEDATGYNMNALDKQVGGDHYKEQKLQPIELAYMVGGTPAFCKLAKYITRNKGDHAENIRKAIHVIELEHELRDYVRYYNNDLPYRHLITLFTDDPYFQRALLALYGRRYTNAVNALEEYLQNANH